MPSAPYTHFKRQLLSGSIDLASDRIMCMLVSGSYVTSNTLNTIIDTHTVTGDIGAHEVIDSDGTYVAGGIELSGKSISTDDSNNRAFFDAADTSWNPSSMTASGAVIYKSGSPAELISFIDFSGDKTSSNGLFQITWSAGGIVQVNHGNETS